MGAPRSVGSGEVAEKEGIVHQGPTNPAAWDDPDGLEKGVWREAGVSRRRQVSWRLQVAWRGLEEFARSESTAPFPFRKSLVVL